MAEQEASTPLSLLGPPPADSAPLGAHHVADGVSFAVASASARAMTLLLFAPGSSAPTWRLPLDPATQRSGDIWQVCVSQLPDGCEYLWEVYPTARGALRHGDEPGRLDHRGVRSGDAPVLLLDPAATCLSGRELWGRRRDADPMRVDVWGYRARVPSRTPFDWQGDTPPRTPLEQSVIYELHVRSFTRDASAGVTHPGTYAGLIEKIPYLKRLGVTAVELLPVHEFNETENLRTDPTTGARLLNVWGYSTVGYFAPKASYASRREPGGALHEFREMVRACHAAGLEVLLDVVYNHTAEGSADGPTLHLRGFDDAVYYMHDPATGAYVDTTGCGHTVNANHPRVMALILASLRYWVTEMHVDGFRFDLASSLTRDADGTPLAHPPLMRAIADDPVLRDVKCIAEAWDWGLYHVGSFPGFGRWAEWNGRFRDTVRRFVGGADAQVGDLILRLSGSPDLYATRGLSPGHSVNLVTCHDGFPLADLVRYNAKHNRRNGENNRDGAHDNDSWNCGHEGPAVDAAVESLRARQVRNLLTLLCVSPGALLLLAGDEMGHTQAGNNNAWCQDNETAWLNWAGAGSITSTDPSEGEPAPLWRFVQQLLAWRRCEPLLAPSRYAGPYHSTWHSADGGPADISATSRTLVGHLRDEAAHVCIIAHAHWEPTRVVLPSVAGPSGGAGHSPWQRIIDTSRPSPEDICLEGVATEDRDGLEIAPRSVVVLRARGVG